MSTEKRSIEKKKPVGKKKATSNAVTKVEGGVIYKSDAIALLKKLPDESVDLCITDPAYESLEKWRKLGTTTRLKQSKGSSNQWFETFPNTRYAELFQELYRVMKKGTFIYVFCDEETRDIITTGFSPQTPEANLVQEGQSATKSPLLAPGFKFWKSLVWDKLISGMGYHFPAQKEFIIMAEKLERKGKHRRLNDNDTGDVIPCKRLKGKDYYPTEKPAPLIWKLIKESSNEGDTCLDFFCGSGVVGQMARATKRKFILGDIDPTEAIKRLL